MIKKLFLVLIFLSFVSTVFAYDWEWGSDAWGHRTKYKNYWNDRDGDGVSNYYDRRDDKKNIW